jgi:hypothetical protein
MKVDDLNKCTIFEMHLLLATERIAKALEKLVDNDAK